MPYVLTLNNEDLQLASGTSDAELGMLLRVLSASERIEKTRDKPRYQRRLADAPRLTVSIEHVDLEQIGEAEEPEPRSAGRQAVCQVCADEGPPAPGTTCVRCGASTPGEPRERESGPRLGTRRELSDA